LPDSDGEPLESDWHRLAMNLLIEIVRYHFQGRQDFFCGGNMFIYFSSAQVRNRDYRGPDFFFVWGVDGARNRDYWAIWDEDGKYPHVIIELLSSTTAEEDRTTKKELYAQTFRTPEYFLYDPATQQLEGWRLRLANGHYDPIQPEASGRLWSEELQLFLGTWEGQFQDTNRTWLRFFDALDQLVLIGREDMEQRAEQEKLRADQAEAELAQLRARLAELEAQRQRPDSPTANP
jgi:Uma2 family endonuclease